MDVSKWFPNSQVRFINGEVEQGVEIWLNDREMGYVSFIENRNMPGRIMEWGLWADLDSPDPFCSTTFVFDKQDFLKGWSKKNLIIIITKFYELIEKHLVIINQRMENGTDEPYDVQHLECLWKIKLGL